MRVLNFSCIESLCLGAGREWFEEPKKGFEALFNLERFVCAPLILLSMSFSIVSLI